MATNKTSKLPDIRVLPKTKEDTIKAAEIVDEKLSEYIRKSVEDRNKKVLGRVKK
jgi:hypothetical protein